MSNDYENWIESIENEAAEYLRDGDRKINPPGYVFYLNNDAKVCVSQMCFEDSQNKETEKQAIINVIKEAGPGEVIAYKSRA